MAGDGIVFLCLAVAAGALAFDVQGTVGTTAASTRWALGALIAVLALLTLFEVLDLAGRLGDAGETESVRTSYGLWLVGLGVVAAIVGWVRMPWRRIVGPPASHSG
jgi:ABC-type transport system involved in cytochrome c biogenesis permease component